MSHKIDFATVVPKFLAIAKRGFCRGELRVTEENGIPTTYFCVERALLEAKTPGALWLRKHGKRYKL